MNSSLPKIMPLNSVCKIVTVCKLQEEKRKVSNKNLRENGRGNSDREEAALTSMSRSWVFKHGLEAAVGCCPLINVHL